MKLHAVHYEAAKLAERWSIELGPRASEVARAGLSLMRGARTQGEFMLAVLATTADIKAQLRRERKG